MIELFIGLILFCGLCLYFGVIYPAVAIFYEKIIKHNKKPVKEILKGW